MMKEFHDILVELVSHSRDNSEFVFCYIRDIEIYLTPEEEVRQSALKVIHENLGLDVNQFVTRVEHKNLDIALYHKYQKINFNPSINPFLIIETKRDGANLLNHTSQILNYLRINNCDTGILLTSKTIYLLSGNNDYNPKHINLNYIKHIISSTSRAFDDDIQDFECAQSGSFKSFQRLATKFGNKSKITFLCSEHPAPITAFLFDFNQDYILFDICGMASRAKKHRIRADAFLRLLSISE